MLRNEKRMRNIGWVLVGQFLLVLGVSLILGFFTSPMAVIFMGGLSFVFMSLMTRYAPSRQRRMYGKKPRIAEVIVSVEIRISVSRFLALIIVGMFSVVILDLFLKRIFTGLDWISYATLSQWLPIVFIPSVLLGLLGGYFLAYLAYNKRGYYGSTEQPLIQPQRKLLIALELQFIVITSIVTTMAMILWWGANYSLVLPIMYALAVLSGIYNPDAKSRFADRKIFKEDIIFSQEMRISLFRSIFWVSFLVLVLVFFLIVSRLPVMIEDFKEEDNFQSVKNAVLLGLAILFLISVALRLYTAYIEARFMYSQRKIYIPASKPSTPAPVPVKSAPKTSPTPAPIASVQPVAIVVKEPQLQRCDGCGAKNLVPAEGTTCEYCNSKLVWKA